MSFAQVQQKVPTIQDYIQASPLPLLGFLGGLAASTAETLTFAFDNIKTRMQMNGKQGMPSYSGFGDCIKKTLNTTGFRGFYKGLSAALFRQITYSSVRMWVYENIKRTYFGSDPSFFMKLAAGGFAGAVGCLVGTPGDVFKIRLINDMQGLKYKGLIDCAQKTFQADGYKGFLKGLNVNITRAIVVNAAELASYDQAKGFLVNQCQFKSDSLWTHFLGSTAAGNEQYNFFLFLSYLKKYANYFFNATNIIFNKIAQAASQFLKAFKLTILRANNQVKGKKQKKRKAN